MALKFQYIRPREANTKLCLAIATELVKTDMGETVAFWAVTFKNKNDQFSKIVARDTLEEYMAKGIQTGSIQLGETFTHNEILVKILMNLHYNEQFIPFNYRNFVSQLIWENF